MLLQTILVTFTVDQLSYVFLFTDNISILYYQFQMLKNLQILLKRAEASVNSNRFPVCHLSRPRYSVAIYYRSLYNEYNLFKNNNQRGIIRIIIIIS